MLNIETLRKLQVQFERLYKDKDLTLHWLCSGQPYLIDYEDLETQGLWAAFVLGFRCNEEI